MSELPPSVSSQGSSVHVSKPDCIADFPFVDQDDFTAYVPRGATDLTDPIIGLQKKSNYNFSYDLNLTLEGFGRKISEGRQLACSSFGGKVWSITCRSKKRARGERTAVNPPRDLASSPFEARPQTDADNPFSIQEIVDPLATLLSLRNANARLSGAVIITGATASAKSLIARGLIYEYMRNRAQEYRRELSKSQFNTGARKPHLVTFEDPVEEWFFEKNWSGTPTSAQLADWRDNPIDYTPREVAADATDLQEVLTAALRQTPACVFVAELRDDDSIEQVMNFAGTGHFVVATAHAGSLTEAMDRILRATDSRTSAQRAVVADRLHGLLHVQRSRPLASSKPGNEAASLRPTMLLPSLWKREGSGKHAFVGDGLSALLPSNPALLSDPAVNAAANNQEQRNRAERSPLDSSCLGRYWFAKQLFSNTKTENSAVRKEYESDALRFARNLDLER